MSMEIKIKATVTTINASQWMNKNDDGTSTAGAKNIQVNLGGGYSFRCNQGEETFFIVENYVREGMILEMEVGSISPAPYQQTQTTESGAEFTITKYFLNLQDVKITDIQKPTISERFSHLEAAAAPLTYTSKEGGKGFGRGKKAEEKTPTKGAASNDDDPVF